MFKGTNEGIRTTSSEIFWVSDLKVFNADFDNVFVQVRSFGCLIWKFLILILMYLSAGDYFYYVFVGKIPLFWKKHRYLQVPRQY